MKIHNKANENQEKLIAMLHFFIFLLNIEVELTWEQFKCELLERYKGAGEGNMYRRWYFLHSTVSTFTSIYLQNSDDTLCRNVEFFNRKIRQKKVKNKLIPELKWIQWQSLKQSLLIMDKQKITKIIRWTYVSVSLVFNPDLRNET